MHHSMPHFGATQSRLLYNGSIITCDDQSSIASAVWIEGERIRAVGAPHTWPEQPGPDIPRLDLRGHAVVPGLTDGHAHIDREGLLAQLPSLSGAACVADIVDRLREVARHAPPGHWIVTGPPGIGPEYMPGPSGLAGGQMPDRHDLDRACPDHPVYIRPIWGYWRNQIPLVSCANTQALRRAGITAHTPDPSPEARILRDAAGEPTGVFEEHTLVPVIEHTLMRCAPGFTAHQRTAALRIGMETYNRYGTTAVFEGHGVATEVINAWQTLHEQQALSVRATLAFSPNWGLQVSGDARQLLSEWGRWLARRGWGDHWLRVQGLYAEIDSDPLNNQLRAGNHPCTGWAGFQAGAALPREALAALLIEAAASGVRIAGIWPTLLPLFEEANRHHPIHDLRWTLGHQPALDRNQIAQICDLGLALTTHTNRHIYKDGDRLAAKYPEDDVVPMRTLIDRGVRVVPGSDNLPPSLFGPIWHVCARQTRSGRIIGPDQRISRMEALRLNTRNGAWLTGDESVRGHIAPGMLADLVVLDANPLECPLERLPGIRARCVIVGGRLIHSDL